MCPVALDSGVRDNLARRLVDALASAIPGSVANLRGSLAAGLADLYSDIDIHWEVPDECFDECPACLSRAFSTVRPIESLRSDPDFQNSGKRRLLFVQFQDLPLFWRADVEIMCRSIRGQPDFDRDNPAARGDDWSLTHSAMMNAIGAIKALLRSRPAVAEGSLARACQRIGWQPSAIVLPTTILDLTRQIVTIDPTQAALAGRIEKLYAEAFA